MFYDYVTFFKELTIPPNETLTNININVPRRSYKGILMLCFDANTNDSEEFKNYGVTDINITIEGLANKVYAQNLKLRNQRSEMTKYFPPPGLTDLRMAEYYKDKHTIWIDLRSTHDNALHGSGMKHTNIDAGI